MEALLLGTTPTLSIHALRMESDILHGNFHFYRTAFYPRSPHGERRCAAPTHRQYHPLSIHALRMESDFSPCVQNEDNTELSIHALRMESDVCVCVCVLSIHALRMESDDDATHAHQKYPRFLSTLSAWRATSTRLSNQELTGLSIHALRMESDRSINSTIINFWKPFYPRSPHGERLFFLSESSHVVDFLSTLSAWRATTKERMDELELENFLSTLSAWRATW